MPVQLPALGVHFLPLTFSFQRPPLRPPGSCPRSASPTCPHDTLPPTLPPVSCTGACGGSDGGPPALYCCPTCHGLSAEVSLFSQPHAGIPPPLPRCTAVYRPLGGPCSHSGNHSANACELRERLELCLQSVWLSARECVTSCV